MKISSLYLVHKRDLAALCWTGGIGLAYLGSLNPWFLWPLGSLYVVPAGLLAMMGLYFSATMKTPYFSRKDYLLPSAIYVVLSFYLSFVNSGNLNAFIGNLFHIVLFTTLFMADKDSLFQLSTRLSKAMACLLLVSIPFYLLHLAGFPLPSVNTQYGGGLYSYSNFFFFLVDDRTAFIFPRFHSVFLEPGHLGTATVLLLFSQCGHWRKWHNVVLWVATLMTFSLAAYVIGVVIVFLNMWMQGKHIFKKALLTLCVVSGVVTGAFFYNNGENLVHDLILLRLEVDNEGEMSGDNRVDDWFENEYENYLHSADLFFGRDYDADIPGNSGYRMFIYENGIVGLVLVVALYLSFMLKADSKKVILSVALVVLLCFWVRGYPLWYNNFIPVYVLTQLPLSMLQPIKKEVPV